MTTPIIQEQRRSEPASADGLSAHDRGLIDRALGRWISDDNDCPPEVAALRQRLLSSPPDPLRTGVAALLASGLSSGHLRRALQRLLDGQPILVEEPTSDIEVDLTELDGIPQLEPVVPEHVELGGES